MKFKIIEKFSYYQPEEIIQFIRQNCRPFLKLSPNPVYRGIKEGDHGNIFIGRVRKKRKPKDMNIRMHKELNKAFYKVFGWEPRSEGLFVTSRISDAYSYGETYSIFPIGDFKYVYSKNIPDLYNMQWGKYYTIKNNPKLKRKWDNLMANISRSQYKSEKEKALLVSEFSKKYPEVLESFVKKYYTDKNFMEGVKQKVEIMIKCDKYLAIAEPTGGFDYNHFPPSYESFYQKIIIGVFGQPKIK